MTWLMQPEVFQTNESTELGAIPVESSQLGNLARRLSDILIRRSGHRALDSQLRRGRL